MAAAFTTHDLPTVVGLFSGTDVAAQQRLGLHPNVAGLEKAVPPARTWAGLADPDDDDETLVLRLHEVLAASPATLVAVTLDDLALVAERPNMPGTIDEWPNWRIALPEPLEDVLATAHAAGAALSAGLGPGLAAAAGLGLLDADGALLVVRLAGDRVELVQGQAVGAGLVVVERDEHLTGPDDRRDAGDDPVDLAPGRPTRTTSPVRTPSAEPSTSLISTHASGASRSSIGTRPVLVRVCQCSTVRPVFSRSGNSGRGMSRSSWRIATCSRTRRWGWGSARRRRGGATRQRHVGVVGGAGPLDAAGRVDPLVGDPAVVAQPSRGHPPPLGERVGGRRPAEEPRRAARLLGQGEEDVEVGPGLAGRRHGGPHAGHPALAVRERALLLAPDGGGEHDVGEVGGRGLEAVLHDEQVEPAQRVLEDIAVGNDTTGLVPIIQSALILPFMTVLMMSG